jgi:subtilisin-like proprotein convertase family protein
VRSAKSDRTDGGTDRPAINIADVSRVLLEEMEPRLLLTAALGSFAPVAEYAQSTLVLQSVSPDINSVPVGAMIPSQIRTAYGFDQVLFGSVHGYGNGQTVAIIDVYDDPNALNDLNQFSAQFSLPQFNVSGGPTFTKVGETGGTVPGTDPNGPSGTTGKNTWELEESLDIEWVHAIAPQANIMLVEASSASDTDLIQTAVPWAASQPGVVAVSMSFSGGEFSTETNYDKYFVTPSGHAGVTFLGSTGDSGTPAGYPAYSPNVVAVGGTSLTLNGSAYASETGWSGSGGGISSFESRPSYQTGSYQNGSVTQNTTMRTAPDVAMDADLNTGVAVYDSWDYPSTPWLQVGGTSLSCPMWAGLMAVVDQGRSLAGLASLDGATGTLPALYRLPAADFHDVISGSNGSPDYSAGIGYDLVTGLGTPVANKLIPDLAGVGSVYGTVFQDNNGNGVLNAGETGLSGATVYLDPNNNGVIDSAGPTAVASTNVPLGIPDNSSIGVWSTLSFPGSTNFVTHATVTLSITHSRDSDLSAYLVAPDGTQTTLFSNLSSSGANFTNTTFSDSASTPITSGSAPFSGTFTPSMPLSTFNGRWAGGTWRLRVVDSRSSRTGTLTAWSLTLNTAEASTTTDTNGNYSFVLPTGNYTLRQVPPANNVQTGPSPGANPLGANAVSLSTAGATGQNFGDFPTVLSAPGATDNFYVRLDSTSTYVQISNSNAPLPTPTYQIALAYLPSLTFNLLGSANGVYVDFSNGSPIPTNQIAVNGAANAADTLTVIGQNSSQAFTLGNSQIGPTGGLAIVYSNIASLVLQNCTTSFTGTIQSGPAMTVGGGATLKGGGTLNRSVTLLGGSLAGAMTINGNLSSTGGSISPGAGSGVAGTLNVVGNVTLDHGTTLNYQLSAPNVSGSSGNDLVNVAGDLSLDGTVQVTGLAGFGAGAYTLFDYTGVLSGAGLTVGAGVPGGGFNYRLTIGGGQANLVASLSALGDVNQDGVINSSDIDAINGHFGSVVANLSLARYDLNGDNVVSQADVTYELSNILHRTYGDANLDGLVDFIDFQTLLDHWQLHGAVWAQADFTGDGVVDFSDFQKLLDNWNPAGTALVSQIAADTTSTAIAAASANGGAATPAATTSSTAGAIVVSQRVEQQAAATRANTSPSTSTIVATSAPTSTDAPAIESLSPPLRAATRSGASGTESAEAGYLWDNGQVDLLTNFNKPILAWTHPSRHQAIST